jgi:hypothetical protein
LGFVLCLVQALPLIDLAAVGYLFTDYAIAIAVPGGFGSAPITPFEFFGGFWTTLVDVAGKIFGAIDGVWFPLAAVIAGVSLRAMSLLARRPITFWFPPVVTATIVSLLSSFDMWRDTFFSVWPLSIAMVWFSWTGDVPWLRLCAPSVAALVVLLFGRAVVLGMNIASQRFGGRLVS